jgi:hypothetical protein
VPSFGAGEAPRRSTSSLGAMGSRGALLLTALLTLASYQSYKAGAQTLSTVLFWPNSLLQSAAPCIRGSAPAQPLCEGTPLNALAFIASFPLSVAVYAAITYVIIRRSAYRDA